MMCEYCKMNEYDLAEKEIMHKPSIDLGIFTDISFGVTIQREDQLTLSIIHNDVLSEYSEVIKYCPYCGRKLDEDRAD